MISYWFYRHAVSSCGDMRTLTFHPPLPGPGRQEHGCVWLFIPQLCVCWWCQGDGWRWRSPVQHQLSASSIDTARLTLVHMRRFYIKLYACFVTKNICFYW